MSTEAIEQSIEVGVPIRTAYNQWTQFEDCTHRGESLAGGRVGLAVQRRTQP